MADPLSSLASVLTLVECTAESTKFLLKFFRQFNGAPAQIHQWLEMLESLHFTLSSLLGCSADLDPRYHFPQRFRQRLVGCLTRLQACVDEISKTDAHFVVNASHTESKWDGKARRSWERVKWVAIGSHRMKKLVDIIKLYHFEFSMELFKLLM